MVRRPPALLRQLARRVGGEPQAKRLPAALQGRSGNAELLGGCQFRQPQVVEQVEQLAVFLGKRFDVLVELRPPRQLVGIVRTPGALCP
jgi:hypothetical protein